MFGFFRRDRVEARRQSEPVKALVRAYLALPEEAIVTVSEIDCGNPSCPGLETVILVMVPGRRTQAYRVACPLGAVDTAALRAALAAALPS